MEKQGENHNIKKQLNPVKGICLTEIADLLQFEFLKLNLCKFLK